MPIILYFAAFLLLLLTTSVLINGWFLVTRGQWREEVDGTMVKEGAIFKAWWFFWFKEKADKNYIAYKGSYLVEMLANLRAGFGNTIKFSLKMTAGNGYALENPMKDAYQITVHGVFDESVAKSIEQKLGVMVNHWSADTAGVDTKETTLELYKEEPQYVYPGWLRTVMAGCITCFASIYGTIIYIAFLFLFREELGYTLPKISANEYLLIAFTWIAYMLCLAYVNTYLHKKLTK